MASADPGGYKFVKGKKRGDKTYIYCAEKNRLQCTASGVIINKQIIWKTSHNHDVNLQQFVKTNIKKQLKKEVISSLNDPRVVYDQVCRINTIGSTLVPYQSIKRSMLRWRRKICPKIPASLVQYDQILNSNQWKHLTDYNGGRITVKTLRSGEDDSIVTVFYDQQFLSVLKEIKEINVDTTFKICPVKPKIYQFLTIMVKLNEVAIPIFWAMMQRKTIHAYKTALFYFSRELAPHIQPNTIMIDFEAALRSALLAVFPNAHIRHCWFHYMNCILKRVKKNRKIYNRLQNWQEGAVFIRKLLALPLLPANKISSAFIWIVENISPCVYNTFTDVVNYYSEWWIRKVTPQVFSIYGCAVRTNNDIESYHRLLHQRMKTHPSIWQFTKALVEVQAVARSEYFSINLGLSTRCQQRSQYSDKDVIISYAWSLLRDNRLTTRRFLACANFFINTFNNRFIIKDIHNVEGFINLENHCTNRRIVSPVNRDFQLHETNEIFPIRRENGCLYILLVNKIESSICIKCRTNIADTLSLPCQHWFGCSECTKKAVRSATDNRIYHSCTICFHDCLSFQTIYVV